ncbi:MAG TPA: hypothetical protein VGL65_09505 [Gemmatimonadales bacterium]
MRRSTMAYGSIDLALGDLTAVGLVEELDGGRERRVILRTSHRLAPAVIHLLQAEADFFTAFRAELRSALRGGEGSGLLSAALVGAAARRQEVVGDRIDLLIIGLDRNGTGHLRARVDERADSIRAAFGVEVNVLAYDVGTARAMWRTRTDAAERDVRDAELLAGTPPHEVLDV